MATQLLNAKRGNITEEMRIVSDSEEIDVEILREKIAQGRIVILKNNTKTDLAPLGIGENLRTKICSAVSSISKKISPDKELDKIRVIEQAGCDVLLDLSAGNLTDETRQAILSSTKLPVGTNPMLQAGIETLEQGENISFLTKDKILSTVEKHCMDGVDFISLHCAATKNVFEELKKQRRVLGITSHLGKLIAAYIETTGKENPLYEYFDEIIEIIKPYDVVLSIADTMKPSCIADSNDRAWYLETVVQGELADKAQNLGVQVMIENIGHTPVNDIQSNLKTVKNLTNNAPLFTCASICDSTIGCDHINSTVASSIAGLYGANMFNCTPYAENLICTTSAQARESVVAAKIAARCCDLAKGNAKEIKINQEFLEAQAENKPPKSANCIDKLALDPALNQCRIPHPVSKFINNETFKIYKKNVKE